MASHKGCLSSSKNRLVLHFLYILPFCITLSFIFSLTNVNAVSAKDLFPALIIVYDDGYIQDLTKALPVHQKMDVPAVSSINPSSIGDKNKMSTEDLHILLSNGWEIASHGQYHAFLGRIKVKSNIKRYTNKIEVENAHFVEERYEYLLWDDQKKEQIKIDDIINKKNKSYIKTKYPILSNYSDKSYIKLTQESMKKEIAGSQKKLLNMGFWSTSFIYPYNGYTEQAKNMVKNHYHFARGGQRRGQNFPEDFINAKPLNCFELKGTCFENDLIEDHNLKELLKHTVQTQGLLILYAHTGVEGFSEDRLEYILRTAQDLGLNIVTFQDLIANSVSLCHVSK